MAEIELNPEEIATRKALGRLDEMADAWAERIGLDRMAATIALKDDRDSRITDLVKQAYVEGCYNAYMDGAPAARALAMIDLSAKHDARVSDLLEANNREVERRRELETALRSAVAIVGGLLCLACGAKGREMAAKCTRNLGCDLGFCGINADEVRDFLDAAAPALGVE